MNLVTSSAITMSSREIAELVDLKKVKKMDVGKSGYVYIIQFENGVTKVGKSKNPTSRMRSYSSYCGQAKTKSVKEWVSPILENSNNEEQCLIKACLYFGKKAHGNEWFKGVDFEELVAHTKLFMEVASHEFLENEKIEDSKKINMVVDALFSHFGKN